MSEPIAYQYLVSTAFTTVGSTVYWPEEEGTAYVVGTNAFADIKDALTDAENGNNILVLAGVYGNAQSVYKNRTGVNLYVRGDHYEGSPATSSIQAVTFTNEGIFNLSDSSITATTFANSGTFNVGANSAVNANFTGNGKIVLTGTAFDSRIQIAGVNNIDIANAATFTGSSLEGTEIKVLQTTDETNQNLVLNGATLKAETLTVTGYFYVLGDSSVSATTAASANSKKIYLGKSGNTAEVTLRDSTIVPGEGNLTGVELYHKEGTTAATTANILGKNDIATQIRSNSGTLNIGSATGDKTYLKSASILSFYDNAVGTTSINVNNAVLGVAEGSENENDKKVSFTQYAGVITIENSVVVASSISAKNNRYFQIKGNSSLDVASLSGTITIIAGATLTKSAIAGADGIVSIESGKTVTFAGANSILSAIDNKGTILLAKDGEKAPKLTVNDISGNITVAEDAVDVSTTPAWVIKGTVNPGEGKVVTVPASTYAAIVDSGLYITKENVSTLFVDNKYKAGDDGSAITTDNHILGYNAFDDISEILTTGAGNAPVYRDSTAVEFNKGNSSFTDLGSKIYYYAKTENNAPVVLQGSAAGTELSLSGDIAPRFYLMGDSAKFDTVAAYQAGIGDLTKQNFTIASSLTVSGAAFLYAGQALDADDADVAGHPAKQRYASKVNLTINGQVNAGLYVAPYSTVTVNAGGKVLSDATDIAGSGNISLTIRPGSEVTVNGDKDAETHDLQLKEYLLKYIDGGSVVLNDTKAWFNAIEIDGPDEGRALAAAEGVLTLKNTTLDIKKFGEVGYDTVFNKTQYVDSDLENDLKVTLTEKSVLNVGEGKTFNVLDKITVDVQSGSEIKANAATNSGTIEVKGAGSKLAVTGNVSNAGGSIILEGSNGKQDAILSAASINNVVKDTTKPYKAGSIQATNASITTTGDVTNNGSIVLDNATLQSDNVRQGTYYTTGTIQVNNNSTLKATQTIYVNAGSLSVANSTVEAVVVSASGTFTVTGNSTLKIGRTSGTPAGLTGTLILSDVSLQSGSYVNGETANATIASGKSATFNGVTKMLPTIKNAGSIVVTGIAADDSNPAVAGVLTAGTIDNTNNPEESNDDGIITVNGTLTATSINGGTIALDTEGITIGETEKVTFVVAAVSGASFSVDGVAVTGFDITKENTSAQVKVDDINYTLLKEGASYSLIKTPSQKTLYVGTADALAPHPNYVLGYNAFYNLADALVEAYKESSVTTTIKLLDNTENAEAVNATIGKKDGAYLTLKNNLTITYDETTPVTATIGFANDDCGLMLNPAANGALVINETIETKGGDAVDSGAIYLNMKGVSTGSITVNGALETTSRIKIYGKTIVNGSLSAGEFVWVKAGAQAAAQNLSVADYGLTINGAVNTGRFYFASGVATATEGAEITAESFYFGQHVGGSDYIEGVAGAKEFVADTNVLKGYKAVLNSTGAKWTFTRDFSAGSTDDIKFNGEFNFNGGSIKVYADPEAEAYPTEAWDGAEAGTVKIGALVTLNLLNDATMTVGLDDGIHDFAGSVTNAGAINLKNGAELDVNGAVSNTGAINLEEDAQLEVSGAVSNTGAIKVGAAGDANGSELVANSIENSGTINVNSESTIEVTTKDWSFENTGSVVVDNSTISSVGWVRNLTSSEEVKLEVKNNSKIFAGIYNNAGRIVTFDASAFGDSSHPLRAFYNYGSFTATDSSILGSELRTGHEGRTTIETNLGKTTTIDVGTLSINTNASGTSKGVFKVNDKTNAKLSKDVTATQITATAIKNDGKFNAYAATITGSITNKGTFDAENVSLKSDIENSGTFTMIGGSITGSTVANTGTGKFNASGDLALNIEKFSGTITLNDTATITNSTATSFVDTTAGAGAIETTAGKTVTFVGANTFTDAAFTNNGTITIGSNAATASLTTGAFTNKGTITINGSLTTGVFTNGVKTTAGTTPGTITVNGSLTAGDITNTNGTITIDANDTITATKIVGGSIILDTTKLYANPEATTITLISGLGAKMTAKVYANSAESANVISSGDVIELKDINGATQHYRVSGGSGSTAMTLYKVDGQKQDNLYVKSTYNDTTAAADGLVFGYNAFANLVTALNVAKDVEVADNKKVNVLLGNDTSITKQGMLFYLDKDGELVEFKSDTVIGLGQKTEGTAATSATATIGFKAGDNGLMLTPAAGKNIKIDSGVTLKTTAASGNTDGMCGTVYLNYKGTTGTVTVDGNIQSATDIYFCGAAEVNGNLTVDATIGQLLLRAGKANVAPEGDADPVNKSVVIGRQSGNNETAAQVKGTWVVLISGDAKFNNTVIEVNALGYDNYTNSAIEYQSTPTLTSNNSTWTISEKIDLATTASTTNPKAAEFNFNNSTVKVGTDNLGSFIGGTVNLGSFITMNLTAGSKLTAGAITNNGTFTATTAIVDGTVTNNGTFTANGATLGSSTTNAESNALASLTFEGADSTATYIKNRGGTVTINANLTVSGNFETAALSGKPSITELKAGKTLTANLLLNGATFNATDATIAAAIKNSGTINATNTTLSKSINNSTAGAVFNAIDTALDGISITNSGTFTVKDSSKKLDVTVTGNAIELDNVTLTDAKVVGEATVVGDSTLNGGEFTTLNVAADKKLDVIGGKLTATTVTVAATGALTLKNNASIDVATIDNLVLDGGVYTTAGDDANLKIGSAAALKLDGATLNNVTLDNVSFEVEKVLDDSEEPVVIASSFTGINSIGSLTVDEGAALTISAAATIADLETLSLTVNGYIVNKGTITIDATGLEWGGSLKSMKVIGITDGTITSPGTISVTGVDKTMAIVKDDGIYLFKVQAEVDTETLYVNSDWSPKKPGDSFKYAYVDAAGETVTVDCVFGVNAFANTANLVQYDDTTALVVEASAAAYGDLNWGKDVTMTLSNGDATFGAVTFGAGATINGGFTATSLSVAGAATISGDVTTTAALSVTGNAAFGGNVTAGATTLGNVTVAGNLTTAALTVGDATVKGNVTASGDVALNGVTKIDGTLSSTGDLDLANGASLNMAWNKDQTATIAVAGDLSAGAKSITIDVFNGGLETVTTNKTVISAGNDVAVAYDSIVSNYDEAFFTKDGNNLVLDAKKIAKVSKSYNTEVPVEGKYNSISHAVSNENTGLILIVDGNFGNASLNGKQTRVRTSGTMGNTDPTKGSYLAGGFNVAKQPAETGTPLADIFDNYKQANGNNGNTSVTIENGVFNNAYVVGADMIQLAANETTVTFFRTGNSNLTINGGSFTAPVVNGKYGERAIVGGMLYNIAGSSSEARLIGDVALTITGGTFEGYNVYGGNYALGNKFLGLNTSIKGNVTLTLDATTNTLAFTANAGGYGGFVQAGSFGPSKISKNTEVILKGSKGITFEQLVGGSSSDEHLWDEVEKEWTCNSCVDGNRTLTFSGFSGELDFGKVQDFNVVSFEGENEVNFEGEFHRYFNDDVTTWKFANGASLSGSVVFDLTGDTVDLSACTSDLTILKANVTGFDISKVAYNDTKLKYAETATAYTFTTIA